MARASEEITPFWGDPEIANEIEMASQARGVERDKNELGKTTRSFTQHQN